MDRVTLRTVEQATGGTLLRGNPKLELTGISTDTRTLRPGELFFAIVGEQHDAHAFLPQAARLRAGAAVAHDPDAARHVPELPVVLVPDTTRALGDLAHWHRRQCPATVIGITGSNGKTTTKEMLFHILDGVVRSVKSIRSFNNAWGVPLTLFQLRPADVYAVVEMGTNSPGEIARLCEIADPDVGLLTNVAETHLERLGNIEGVAREKAALLRHTVRRGGAFYNADDYWSRRIARDLRGTLCSFGIENDADVRAIPLRSDQTGIRFKIIGGPRIHLPIAGAHNAANALAAIAVARKLGIDWRTIASRLATFELPPMRMQLATTGGVTIINDAYNANPVSLEAAAQTLHRIECPGKKILALADMLELGEQATSSHRRLGKTIAGFDFDYLLGIGSGTAELLDEAARHGMHEGGILLARSKEEMAAALLELLEPGDVVLFKGSRANQLEEIVDRVQTRLGAARKTEFRAPVYDRYRSAGHAASRPAEVPEPSALGHTVG